MKVILKQKSTGELKEVTVGPDWFYLVWQVAYVLIYMVFIGPWLFLSAMEGKSIAPSLLAVIVGGAISQVPLFQKRATVAALIMVTLNAIAYIAERNGGHSLISIFLNICMFGFFIYLLFENNRTYAKKLIGEGYTFTNPDNEISKYAAEKWGIVTQNDNKVNS